jgi:uncharacterized RDD family membrane protein YckC
MQQDTAILDTRRAIETPEGVELGLRVAGPIVRAYAWIIDFLIRAAIYLGLFFILTLILGKLGIGLFLILAFLLEWFYPVLFEVYKQGATPGKMALKIKVVRDDGTEVNLQSSLIRNLLRGVDIFPVYYAGAIPMFCCFGLFAMLFNREFKRLGDFAAGTIVVYQDKLKAAAPIIEEAPRMPPVALAANEQKAVIQYAERLNLFTPQRCSELANILSGMTRQTNEQAVKKIIQYANWMMGRR